MGKYNIFETYYYGRNSFHTTWNMNRFWGAPFQTKKEDIDDKECIFAIGRINKVTKTKVYMQHFDADRIWEKELWEIPFTEITSVSFGTRYVKTFSKYV